MRVYEKERSVEAGSGVRITGVPISHTTEKGRLREGEHSFEQVVESILKEADM